MKTTNILLVKLFSQKFLIFALFFIISLFSFNCILAQTTMQSWRWSDCRDLATPTGTNFTQGPILTDERDGKQYEIRKFADGQCWMVDNLMYGGNTDACAGKSTFAGNGSATPSNQFGTGTFGDCRDPRVGGSAPCTAGSTTCGYYYNWQAVMQHSTAWYNTTYTGPTTNVQGLCPEGWRLPTSNTGGDFEVLHLAAGSPATGFWQGGNWKGPFSGNCISTGGLNNQGSRSHWWSSTPYSTTYAYGMRFDSSAVDPSFNRNKYNGCTVRCLKNYEGEDPQTDGEYTYVKFLQDGIFTPPTDINSVDVLVVAGGGGGGASAYSGGGAGGGGGGAGDCLLTTDHIINNQAIVTVGQGGLASKVDSTLASNGENSSFDSLIAIGGGGGGTPNSSALGINGKDGGSGGGGSSGGSSYGTGTKGYAIGNGYGNDGGNQLINSGYWGAGGGGGAGENGYNGDANGGGNGGDGYYFGDLFGTSYGDNGWFCGGGGGGAFGDVSPKGLGGQGGGGSATNNIGVDGTNYTGGGGGGGSWNGSHHAGGDGGSGIVIVRYKTIEAAWSENYYLQFGEFIFGETATASAIRLNIDQMEIDFGNLTPEIFVQKTNQLTVNSNIPIGYSLYIQQNDLLKVSNYRFLADEQKARGIINNTSCDQQNCGFNQASAWTNPKNSGLGYTVSGPDTLADFNNGQLYRSIPSAASNEEAALIAQDRQATDLLRDRHTQVQYQLAISGATLAGTYNNAMMYTLVPNF